MFPEHNIYQHYRRFFPTVDTARVRTLGAGATPLIPSCSIGPAAGLRKLHFKLESLNPSGSYKDRFASLAVHHSAQRGQQRLAATSSGNTGAALAAYCAAAGIECFVFVTERAASGKLSQMQAHGARVFRVAGMGIDSRESAHVGEDLRRLTAELGVPLCISAYAECPDEMEGIRTIAFELAEQATTLEHVVAPVGGGGLFVAIARGFSSLRAEGYATPRLHAVQPELNDTVVTPWNTGADRARSVETSTSISGLAVARDLDGTRVLAHLRDSGGSAVLITDEEARVVQRRLLLEEGLLVEPAGAVSVAGALRLVEKGVFAEHSSIVCILTGHGFKDSASVDIAANATPAALIKRADIAAVLTL